MIDINKKYRTRDGREVRIYAVDGGQLKDTVHGATLEKGCWCITSWDRNGEWSIDNSHWNLIEVRPRHKWTVWLNVYGPESFTSHISREQAEDEQDTNRTACIKVELDYEEGEGL